MLFWLNVIFWAIVVLTVAIDQRKPHFDYDSYFRIKKCLDAKNYEYAFYYILHNGSYSLDYHLKELFDACSKSQHLQDRVFGRYALIIGNAAKKHPGKSGILFDLAVCLSYCCYNTVTTLFTICLMVTLFTHQRIGHLVQYMETSDKVLYYGLPIGVLAIVFCILVKHFKKPIDWSAFRYAFVVAFFINLPFVIFAHDWKEAQNSYVEEMIDEFGEDWEEELEDARIDAMSRRP